MACRDSRHSVAAAHGALALTVVLLACGQDGEPAVLEPDPGDRAPAALAIHGGDGQSAVTGTPVPLPVRVLVTGHTGDALADVAVAFLVTSGGGSVDSATARTRSDGTASPGLWRMGRPGPQQMRADVAGLAPVSFQATSVPAPAAISVVAGQDQTGQVGLPVPVAPEVLVSADDGSPVPGIKVSFTTSGDARLTHTLSPTDAQGRASSGEWTLGTRAGAYHIEAAVPDAPAIDGAPAFVRARATAGPARALTVVAGDDQETETTLPVPRTPSVLVQDRYGNAVSGAPVSFDAQGGSMAIPAQALSDSAGIASVWRWVLGPRPHAIYRLAASISDGDSVVSQVVFTARATQPVYRIEIVYANPSSLSASMRSSFDRARQYWESAIGGNLPWSTVRKSALERCLSDNDVRYPVTEDRIVDDLLIFVDIRDTGPGILGGAGPCQIRADSGLPLVGIMFFPDRISDATILHEMAHVIGFGALWQYLGILEDPAGRAGADPHFVGAQAMRVFAELKGDTGAAGRRVPVENLGGEGIWNGHWRESVFGPELMTGMADGGVNPLSALTLASLLDLGYDQVDLSLADDYALPAAPDRVINPLPGDARPPLLAKHRDHLLASPMAVVRQDGTVVRYQSAIETSR